MGQKDLHEFRVVLRNVDLSEEDAQRINAAIQRAALSEIAAIDLRGDMRVLWPGQQWPWHWLGLWFDSLTHEAVQRAGLELPQEFPTGER